MTRVYMTITGARAEAKKTGPLTSGMVGVPVQFTFDPQWEGLNKLPVFRAGSIAKDNALTEDTSHIPHEVLQSAGETLYIGVEGRSAQGDLVIPTVWAAVGRILPGAQASNDEALAPTPSQFERFMAEVEQVDEKITASLHQAKESGEFDGADGVSVTHAWEGTTLKVTSASGSSQADLKGDKGDKGDRGDGFTYEDFTREQLAALKGDKGDKGDPGIPGSDGFSPTVQVYNVPGGHQVRITDKDATRVFDVMDGKTDADWNAKEGEAGHIANRTHWAEENAVLLEETEAVKGSDPNFGTAAWLISKAPKLKIGENYTVIYNGVSYTCAGISLADTWLEVPDDAVGLGNFGVVGGVNTGHPFLTIVSWEAQSMVSLSLDAKESVKIGIKGDVVHKLDPKFLPDNMGGGTYTVVFDMYMAEDSFEIVTGHSFAEVYAAAADPNTVVRGFGRVFLMKGDTQPAGFMVADLFIATAEAVIFQMVEAAGSGSDTDIYVHQIILRPDGTVEYIRYSGQGA